MVPENTSISKADALAEAYKRGLLPPDKKAAYEEAMKRGLVQPAATPPNPAPMSQPDATPWGDGQAFDDMYARKPQTDPMNLPLMPGARTLTSGQPTRMKPPPAPRGPVMSPAQRQATQPDRDEAARVRKYNEELALMNAASPIPFKNTGPYGPLELNQERPDLFAGRATGAFVNSNIGVANTLGQLGLSTANAFGAAGDPSMQGALAGGEYGDITQRVADAAEQGGYVRNQQAVGDILPSLPIPAPTTAGEMAADVTGNLASVFTGFGAPILKGGKALSETLATVPGMSRTLRGVGVETGENAALAYGLSAGAAPPGSDRNMAGTQGAADPFNYVTIEGARAVPRALKALDAPTTPTNAGGVGPGLTRRQGPPVAPAVAATQTAQQAPTQPQTATAPPVPPIPPNAPAVTAGAPQPVPARSRAEQRADDLLIKKLAADGITMDDVRKIQARLARRGDSGVYETIGEIAALTDKSSGANLRGLQMAGGAAPGPLQEALVGLVNQNTEKLSPRLSRGATRATGQKADNAVATLDELETRLRTEATPAYDDAYATPVNPQVFANEILPVLNTPSGQKALQAARNNLASIAADLQGRAARGASERAMMESQRAQAAVKSIDDFMADPVRGTAIPTTMALDYTKRAFDDVIADAGFGSDTARIVGGTKRNFADSVSQATGGQYGNALGVFEDVKRLEDAFEVGTQALNKKTWELERELAKGRGGSPWTAGEVEALAMGVARNIEDLIEANNQSALTKLLKDKALKNMATALGSQKAADMFEETIRRLGANREWGRRVAGGSDTAMRQAAIRDAGMEGEDAITRVLDRVETSGNQFSLPGLVNDVAVKPIARTAKDIYQRLRYPGVYDEEVNRALIPLIGKPMTEGNLNEVIRRVEARMAEKGLIPPVQPAAVAAPPPAPRSRPRGPRGNPPGTTSSASATGTGIVAGGVLGAMAPADDENEQFINALFTAAGVGTAAGVAAKLAKGGKPPPASGKGAKPKAPPAKPAFDQRFMKEAQRLVSYNGGVDKALKAQQYVIDQLKNSKAPNAQDRLNRAVSVQYAIRRMADRSNRELDEIAATAPRSGPPGVKPPPVKMGFGGRDLPMDEGSRMERARSMGFDVDRVAYRGLGRAYDESGKGGGRRYQMFTSSESDAAEYGSNVVSAYLRKGNNLQLDGGGRNFNSVSVSQLPEDVRAKLHPSIQGAARIDDIADAAQKAGYDSVTVANVFDNAWGEVPTKPRPRTQKDIDFDNELLRELGVDPADMPSAPRAQSAPKKNTDPVTIDVIFDTKNIRSKDAAFDPSQEQSSKLLAGMSGNAEAIGAGTGAVLAPDVDGDGEVSFGERAGAALTGGIGGNLLRRASGKTGAPNVRGPRAPDQGTFGGRRGADNLAVQGEKRPQQAMALAERMEAQGASRDEIWAATSKQLDGTQYAGVFKGSDGKWKFEIDDSRSTFNETERGQDYLRHPDGLFKAYRDVPGMQDLGDVSVMRSGSKDTGAFMGPGTKIESIHIGKGSSDPRSIALHEYQHGIQARENFARGGMPETALDDRLKEINNELTRLSRGMDNRRSYKYDTGIDTKAVEAEIADMKRQYNDLMDMRSQEMSRENQYAAYRKLAGETEARNVQTRRDFTPEQRRAKAPWTTQDVPDDQQIVRFGSGKAESRPTGPKTGALGNPPNAPKPMGPPQTGNNLKSVKPPPKGPSTVTRALAGAALGGAAGSLGGDANAQSPETTAQIERARKERADVLGILADIEAEQRFFATASETDLQKRLDREGFDLGPTGADGTIGKRTRDAINGRKAQLDKKFDAARARLTEAEASIQKWERQAASEKTRPGDAQKALREWGPILGALAGLGLGAKLRGGAVKKAAKQAPAQIAKANQLLTPGPLNRGRSAAAQAALKKQPANLNEFWQLGGAKDQVPFEVGAKGQYKGRKKSDVMPPSQLFPNRRIRSMDVGVMAGGVAEGTGAQMAAMHLEGQIRDARDFAEKEPTEANLARVEALEDQHAIAVLMSRLGFGIAGGRLIGSLKMPYAGARPDVASADAERALLLEYLKKVK